MHTKVHLDKKHILVLGGGYCGLRTAKLLAKKLEKFDDYQVILIDKQPFHLYSSNLYEIATAYYPDITQTCLRELSDSITIPFHDVLKGTSACFLGDTIEKIDYSRKRIFLKDLGYVPFEYLVVALGAVTNFYGIPGIQENAFPLKTIEDGLALECHFEQTFRERMEKNIHSPFHVVIGGGGFTGVEYACELPGFIRKLSEKYRFDPKEVKILVVEKSSDLIGLSQDVSTVTMKRFGELGITWLCETSICGYTNKKLELQMKDRSEKKQLPCDVLIWTAGVQSNPLLNDFPVLHESGCLDVEPNLESTHYPKVYVGGDTAAVFDVEHHGMLPKLGFLAAQQASVIAYNIWADIAKKPQKTYIPKHKGFIVSLGGKSFLYHKNKNTWRGLSPWIRSRLLDFWYFSTLLPFMKALKKWWKTEHIFVQND
jgi:NADH:ubiquinone reductase (H+-translocating)